MVKKTIIAVVSVVLLVSVFAGAYSGQYNYNSYARYAGYAPIYYAGVPYYNYYPIYHYPFSNYYDWLYEPYYKPSVAYPASVSNLNTYSNPSSSSIPRGSANQWCGVINNKPVGCDFGLVCDYTKSGITAVGVCSKQNYDTTYPYQVSPSITNAYYYS